MGCIGAKGWKASGKCDRVRQFATDRSACQLTLKLDCLRASRQGPSKSSKGLSVIPSGGQRPKTAGEFRPPPTVPGRLVAVGPTFATIRSRSGGDWSQVALGHVPSTDRQDFHRHAAT
jgi:hypothetical protein